MVNALPAYIDRYPEALGNPLVLEAYGEYLEEHPEAVP
jgi:hypothetical protein